MGWESIPFWQQPLMGREDPFMRSETGEPVMRDVGGNVFTLGQMLPPEEPVSRPGGYGLTRTGGNPYPDETVALGDLLGAVAGGYDAPARALRGEPLTYGDALSTAMDMAGGGAFGAAPEGALRGNLARPPVPRGAVAHGTPTGTLEPERVIPFESLEGRTLIPAYGDRTRAGFNLQGVNDVTLNDAVRLQGGVDHMREEGMGAWASRKRETNILHGTVRDVAEQTGDPPILAYTAMGPTASDSSHMMQDTVLGMLTPNLREQINPVLLDVFDERMGRILDERRLGRRGVPQLPYPGLLSDALPEYLRTAPGDDRTYLFQSMDAPRYRSMGFPDVGAAREAITEPDLFHARHFDTGRGLAVPDVDTPPILDPEVPHGTYEAQLPGEYLGRLPEDVPGDLLWRDFFADKEGKPHTAVARSFMLNANRIRQKVTPQIVDEVMRYLEGRRDG